MFHLTPDHKYLVWFLPKKSSEETRIRIKEISKVVEQTSFTLFYGKETNGNH